MSKETAKQFWRSQTEYPSFGPKQRRFYEAMWLIPRLEGIDSLLDVGCGSGEFLELIIRMADVPVIYGCDIAENLLAKVNKKVKTFYYDFYEGESLPKVDAIILWASFQYIFEDSIVEDFLSRLDCKKLFIRTPCDREDLVIDKYSDDLGAQYSSRYITLDKLIKLLSQYFTVVDVSRAYPDDIESKYGSKQWLIECIKEV
jgi:SAM-dependent methyltransferase